MFGMSTPKDRPDDLPPLHPRPLRGVIAHQFYGRLFCLLWRSDSEKMGYSERKRNSARPREKNLPDLYASDVCFWLRDPFPISLHLYGRSFTYVFRRRHVRSGHTLRERLWLPRTDSEGGQFFTGGGPAY